MERFLGFVKQIRRSRRRKGKKYRPEEDYHEGYEDVYYYASEHLHRRHQTLITDDSRVSALHAFRFSRTKSVKSAPGLQRGEELTTGL
ncbi:glutamate receptor-interacting protein 1 isoform X9 [Clarias magur]|uniref:Glutamate receptor-interacting protein 1 isoform X9 n=1 Tax=Clarias magur TaxID=1594786 RepID=A0A8J4U1J2_CLAMG|nr:glutamate receptor-interacting protein 1 isoform X9 [Clarias magur]